MTFTFTATMVGMGTFALTTSRDKIGGVGIKKLQANLLAESSLEALFDQIRREMASTGNYSFNLPTANYITGTGANRYTVGQYEARVVSADQVEQDLGSGGNKFRRTTYTFLLEGKGVARGGSTSVLRARFTATREQALVPITSNPPNFANNPVTFPIGAMISNSKLEIITNGTVQSTAPNGTSGHMLANGGISWNRFSGTKSSVTSSIVRAQGQYIVPDGSAYQYTVGPNGLGNSNGSINYENPGMPASGNFLGSPANSVIRSSGPVAFANNAKISTWVTRWQGATTQVAPVPSINASQLGPVNGVNNALQCPVMINGDLNINAGETIRLLPKSTNPWENVIYVKGNIRNAGALLNLGVTLVVEGKYIDTASAKYDLSEIGSPFSTSQMVRMRSSLMSLNTSADAITFHQDASTTTGLVYALKGGIQADGSNTELTGSFVSGSSDPAAGIRIAPRDGSSFKMNFDPYSATGGPISVQPGQTTWVPGSVTLAWNPTKLSNWSFRQ